MSPWNGAKLATSLLKQCKALEQRDPQFCDNTLMLRKGIFMFRVTSCDLELSFTCFSLIYDVEVELLD